MAPYYDAESCSVHIGFSVSPSKVEIRMAYLQYPGACLSQASLRVDSNLVYK